MLVRTWVAVPTLAILCRFPVDVVPPHKTAYAVSEVIPDPPLATMRGFAKAEKVPEPLYDTIPEELKFIALFVAIFYVYVKNKVIESATVVGFVVHTGPINVTSI